MSLDPFSVLRAARDCGDLTVYEIAALTVLVLRADNRTGAVGLHGQRPSCPRLAEEAKQSDRRFRDALSTLASKGWIMVERHLRDTHSIWVVGQHVCGTACRRVRQDMPEGPAGHAGGEAESSDVLRHRVPQAPAPRAAGSGTACRRAPAPRADSSLSDLPELPELYPDPPYPPAGGASACGEAERGSGERVQPASVQAPDPIEPLAEVEPEALRAPEPSSQPAGEHGALATGTEMPSPEAKPFGAEDGSPAGLGAAVCALPAPTTTIQAALFGFAVPAPPTAQPPASPRRRMAKAKPKADVAVPQPEPSGHKAVVDCYFAEFERARGVKPAFGAQDGKMVQRLLERVGTAERACEAIRGAFANAWWARNRGGLAEIAKEPNQFLGRGVAPSSRLPGRDVRLQGAPQDAQALAELDAHSDETQRRTLVQMQETYAGRLL